MASALAVLAEEWFRVDRGFAEEIERLNAGKFFYLFLCCCVMNLILGFIVLPFEHGKAVIFTPAVSPVLTALEKIAQVLFGGGGGGENDQGLVVASIADGMVTEGEDGMDVSSGGILLEEVSVDGNPNATQEEAQEKAMGEGHLLG